MRADGTIGEGALVPLAPFLGDQVDADARHAGGGPGEVAIHEVPVQADGLEDLGAAVALQRRDPHLGHDLEDLDAAELRSEEHTSELQSQSNLVCRLLLEKKKK